MEVVVVLPCVPATAITRRPAITEASAAARCTTRIPRLVASASSGLSGRMVLETPSARAEPAGAGGQHDARDPGLAPPADAGEVHPAEPGRWHRLSLGD